MKTILPVVSPSSIVAACPASACSNGRSVPIVGWMPRLVAERAAGRPVRPGCPWSSRPPAAAGRTAAATRRRWRRRWWRRRSPRAARLERLHRVRPGGLADGLEHAVHPFGQPRAGLERCRRAPSSVATARFASVRPVTHTRRPAALPSAINAVATPPEAPCTSMVWPGRRPDFTNSIRYAVSHAVPMQAASANDRPAGFGSTLRARHDDVVGERALVLLGEQGALRVERLVADPAGAADHRVDDDLGAVLQHAGAVAAEDHRELVRLDADAAQRPQVVHVQAGGAHAHTFTQPGGGVGSSRSPTTSAASGSSGFGCAAYTANMLPEPTHLRGGRVLACGDLAHSGGWADGSRSHSGGWAGGTRCFGLWVASLLALPRRWRAGPTAGALGPPVPPARQSPAYRRTVFLWLANWWDGVDLWLSQLAFPLQFAIVIAVLAPLCWGSLAHDRVVDRLSGRLRRTRELVEVIGHHTPSRSRSAPTCRPARPPRSSPPCRPSPTSSSRPRRQPGARPSRRVRRLGP